MNLLEAGIRAEGLRQQAIANNIANLNTPGYRRTDVNFEEVLSKALEKTDINTDKLDAEFVQPLETPINELGNDVAMDSEVGEMIKNSLRHKAYMLVLKKKYQQMDAAIKVQ